MALSLNKQNTDECHKPQQKCHENATCDSRPKSVELCPFTCFEQPHKNFTKTR